MPELDISSIQLKCLQTVLDRSDIEIPDPSEIPTAEEWIDEEPSRDIEAYAHEVGAEKALVTLYHSCPICGDTACDKGVAYVGSTPIHADQHPEAKAARGRAERGRRQL
jgi:hypothetical protein